MNEPSPFSFQKIRWPLAVTAALCALFWVLKPVIALLAGSAALAYIFDPVIDALEARGFTRSTGIGF